MFRFFFGAPIGTGSVLGGGICTQLICTHDHAFDYHVGSKTKWKEVDQDACQEKLTH